MRPEPRDLIMSRVCALPGGVTVHAVIGEGSPMHNVPPGAYIRRHDGRAWSEWVLVEAGARDIDVTAAPERPGTALVSVVTFQSAILTAPAGTRPVAWPARFFWFTAGGLESAGDL